jgi:hypothetical protein
VHRVHLNPSIPGRWSLDPYRQPIDFGEVPEIVEGSTAYLQIVGVDGDIKVAVVAGLPPNQCRDTPAAANPVAHARIIQGIENPDDLGKQHAGRPEPARPTNHPISAHQHLARERLCAEIATGPFGRHDRRMTAQPLLRSVDAVTVPVPDLDAGLGFYRDRLGHSLLWRHGEIGQAGLQLAASDTELVLTTRGAYVPRPGWLA